MNVLNRSRIHETLSLLRLFINPSKNRASALYDLLSTHNNLAENSLYLNLGYWKNAETYDAACQALAEQLADVAQINQKDAILDVGFGFADQDMFWLRHYRPSQIVGLNITASQVSVARRRIIEAGMDDRIRLEVGSATQMPFEAGIFDKVLALETAFHYDTREAFFHEAYRVLRPGGRLATADILPLSAQSYKNLRDRIGDYLGRCFWQIPKANMYLRDEYKQKLRVAGFVDIKVHSIREFVYAPFASYARKRLQDPVICQRLHPMINVLWKASLNDMEKSGVLDYVLVTADKK